MNLILNLCVFTHLITFAFSMNANESKRIENIYTKSLFDYKYYDDNYTIDVNLLVFPTSANGSVEYEDNNLDFELPDDALADSDLKDRDFVDSIPYVSKVKTIGDSNKIISKAVEFTINGVSIGYGFARTIYLTFSENPRKARLFGIWLYFQLLFAMAIFNIFSLCAPNEFTERDFTSSCGNRLVTNYFRNEVMFWVFIFICFVVRDTAGFGYLALTSLYGWGSISWVTFLQLQYFNVDDLYKLLGDFTAMASAMLWAFVMWILRYKENNIFVPRMWYLNKPCSNCADFLIIKREFQGPSSFGKYNLVHTFILVIYLASTSNTLYTSSYEIPRCIASIVGTIFVCCFLKVNLPMVNIAEEAGDIEEAGALF